jgi:hypothetical protein
MKYKRMTCLAVLIATTLGAQGQSIRTDINPALLYYQAFLLAPKTMSDADWDYLGSKAGREQNIPERFGPLLAGYDSEFRLVRQAARQTVPCDWGIDMSPGPGTMLPHLAFVKAVAVASQPRAIWDLEHGDQADARDDLLGAFALGRNAGRDGTLIGALVQQASEAIVLATVAGNFGKFSPDTLLQLEAGFEATPPLATVATAVLSEKSNHVDWLEHKIRRLQQENPGNDARVMAAIHKDKELEELENIGDNPATNFWQRVFTASGESSEGILRLVQETEPLYLRVTQILSLPLPEYDGQMQKFAAEIQQSQNPFVQLLFLDPLRPRPREFKIQAWQAMVHAAVEYKLHGEAGLKSVSDPFGSGPFTFQRFVFEGVDRGFELKSGYAGLKYPCALIFVERMGPAFRTDGPYIGQAVEK